MTPKSRTSVHISGTITTTTAKIVVSEGILRYLKRMSENSNFEANTSERTVQKSPYRVREWKGSHSVPSLAQRYLGVWLVGHTRWNSVSGSQYPQSKRSLHSSPRMLRGHHSQRARSSHPCPSSPRNKWEESLSRNRISFCQHHIEWLSIRFASWLWNSPSGHLCDHSAFVLSCDSLLVQGMLMGRACLYQEVTGALLSKPCLWAVLSSIWPISFQSLSSLP